MQTIAHESGPLEAALQGIGWVTPLGCGTHEVWQRWQAGAQGKRTALEGRPCMRINSRLPDALAKNPRLRRASPITLFTATAALAALNDAGLPPTPEQSANLALVTGVSTGSVVYTRKFHEQIVTDGARAASPLLFPETVYNAAAGHLAALLGIAGATYTLVGDGAVGLSALHFGAQLLATGAAERVLVVAGEELDAICCHAYAAWRMNALFSEGAAAVVLGHEGPVRLRVHAGQPFFRRSEMAEALRRSVRRVLGGAVPDAVVCSANGTFLDAHERTGLVGVCPPARAFYPKQAFGESLGAGALIQTVAATLVLQHTAAHRVLVSALGFNQQAAAALLAR